MYRKYINIVEAANKGCPIATYDIDVNLKNRQKAIDEYHYGPANPNEPESYWKDAAKRWNITEKTARTMLCGNCAAFIQTDSMMACIIGGLEKDEAENELSYDEEFVAAADLGYCDLFQFTCAAARTCDAWKSGGPIKGK
jgi:hypothetical protein